LAATTESHHGAATWWFSVVALILAPQNPHKNVLDLIEDACYRKSLEK
jgi:hypothetical protein